MISERRGFLLSCLAGLAGGWAMAGEGQRAYYVVLFGAQKCPYRPKFTHTFATFVETSVSADGQVGRVLESHTISWLPASLEIKRIGSTQVGHNFTLNETLDWSVSAGMTNAVWGPYQIEPWLYEQALAQIAHLESGQVRYKALEDWYPKATTSNCVHAVEDVTGGKRKSVPVFLFGEPASRRALDQLLPGVIDPEKTYPWVGEQLRLDRWPLVPRTLADRTTALANFWSFLSWK